MADPLTDALAGFTARLPETDLSSRIQRDYVVRVRDFLAWAGKHHEEDDVLGEPQGRDAAVRNYRNHLSTLRGPATVNKTLAALDHFYIDVGLGRPTVDRVTVADPVGLTSNQQRTVEAAAQDMTPRDRAILFVLLHTNVSLESVAELELGDVHSVTNPTRLGDSRLPEPARKALLAWLRDRPNWPGADTSALWLNRFGTALSARSMRGVVRECGKRARMPGLQSSTLRMSGPTQSVDAVDG